MRRTVPLAALLASVLLAACGSSRTGHTRILSVPWLLLQAKGRWLTVSSDGGGCLRPDHTDARETNRSVTVSVYYRLYTPRSGEACTAEVRLHRATLTLSRPLGARSLLHGPASQGTLAATRPPILSGLRQDPSRQGRTH